ncbi:hypothetical protein LZ012_17875 [Dechloromonas sp. XY25]|uniref:Flagellar protein FliT n=1 Tax=Dechloromonas hankyongensis TaxID=2908002 RepID=A0ABS9K6R8_9RHOO|nr:hypothetical protein [Dechloromonas hankyongensis]MCG2578867.1 hypothetical protein [Dechloromonas hankyongensis]
MTPSVSLIGLYQELQKLHAAMATNAVCQRFTELPDQQSQVDTLVARIQTIPPLRLSAEQQAMISGLIKDILANQLRIKAEIADWQNDVSPFLASFDAHPLRK